MVVGLVALMIANQDHNVFLLASKTCLVTARFLVNGTKNFNFSKSLTRLFFLIIYGGR
jgi:hypothetical protein